MSERSFQVQRGELPAENIRELVDAQRQNLCAAGFDMSTMETVLERSGAFTSERDRRAFDEAFERLQNHLSEVDRKATLAFNHYCEKLEPRST